MLVKKLIISALLAAVITGCCSTPIDVETVSKKKHNVLLICVDDLRSELGCTGQSYMHTPNIDSLAQSGRLFTNHYAHQAACGPSRCTLLSGTRTDNWVYFRSKKKTLPKNEAVTLPELFQNAGYSTATIGKVDHAFGSKIRGFETDASDYGPWKDCARASFGYANGVSYHKKLWPKQKPEHLPWEGADVADTSYPDGLSSQAAVKQLQVLSKGDKPFFLAVGFHKPHLPFCAPKKYWDLYDREKLPVASWKQKPRGVKPDWTLHHGTIKNYEPTTHYKWLWGDFNVPEEQGKTLRHAYSACISYMDAQVGNVLDEVTRLKLQDDTIVVLWSDHGWHLGEHGIWGKFTLHDVSVRSPLIVRVPGVGNAGKKSAGLVETVDILPTLCQLAGIKCGKRFEGTSFAANVLDPSLSARDSALSNLPVDHGQRGWSIKTATHRYTRWYKDWHCKEIILEEFYDHKIDPDETNNIAANPSNALINHRKIMDRRLKEANIMRVYGKIK